jgi:hypothetical protein
MNSNLPGKVPVPDSGRRLKREFYVHYAAECDGKPVSARLGALCAAHMQAQRWLKFAQNNTGDVPYTRQQKKSAPLPGS